MQNQNPSIKVHEWMAVTAIIVVMLALTLISIFNRKYAPNQHHFKSSKGRIEVIVKGAVVHPGIYTLPHNLSLGELLEVAGTTPEADMRRFNVERPLLQGRVINIPKREMITVHVKWDNEQVQMIIVPRGTRVEELVDKVKLPENIDSVALKKKRRLKDGEVIKLTKK